MFCVVEEKSKTSGRGMVVTLQEAHCACFGDQGRGRQPIPFAYCAVYRDFRDPAKAAIKRQREEYVVRSIRRLANREFRIGGSMEGPETP